MRSDVRNVISARSSPLDSIEKKLNARKDRLQVALIRSREFKDAVESFEDHLMKLEESCANKKPISVVYEDAERQSNDNEVGVIFLPQP